MDHSIARKSTSLRGPQTAPCCCFLWAVARLAFSVRQIPLIRTPRLRQDRTAFILAGIVSCITRHIQRLFFASNGTQPSASWLQQLQIALSLLGLAVGGEDSHLSLVRGIITDSGSCLLRAGACLTPYQYQRPSTHYRGILPDPYLLTVVQTLRILPMLAQALLPRARRHRPPYGSIAYPNRLHVHSCHMTNTRCRRYGQCWLSA